MPGKSIPAQGHSLNFIIILKLSCEVFKREIAVILTLVWNADSQMSQARESVSRKIVFAGKPFLIFVKCFQMLCRKPIIPLLSILPERGFLSLSDVHHKMDFIFFLPFFCLLKETFIIFF